MKLRILDIVQKASIIIALVLAILPWGVKMNFMSSPGNVITNYYSYFSLIPVGYAIVGPFITAISLCLIVLLTVLFYLSHSRLASQACIFLVGVSIIASIISLFISVTPINIIVIILLITYLVIHYIIKSIITKLAAQRREEILNEDE